MTRRAYLNERQAIGFSGAHDMRTRADVEGENTVYKSYRVWCGDTAALVDAISEQHARDYAQKQIDSGDWIGPITKIECLDV